MNDNRGFSIRARQAAFVSCWFASCMVEGFSVSRIGTTSFVRRQTHTVRNSCNESPLVAQRTTLSMIYAPPGSGYSRPEDETSELPDSYEPMMEYPGTMRPGRTPENMPFHDLPIADTDPDPVPWPHFQQIEWHHRWDPPHPHPVPMEEFIDQQGRWATPEMEAAMRAGNRRDARRRREMEEEKKRDNLIMDDDEDDIDEPQDLGDGMFGQLGSAADQAMTAAATSPTKRVDDDLPSVDDDDDDGDFGDFLLDLGLDTFDVEEDNTDDIDEVTKPPVRRPPTPAPKAKITGLEDVVISDDDDDDTEDISISDVTASIDVDDDDDMDLALDDEDDLTDDGVSTVPLEDFGDNDSLDTEEFFDDGGFDFDDGDFDGGDVDVW